MHTNHIQIQIQIIIIIMRIRDMHNDTRYSVAVDVRCDLNVLIKNEKR